MTSGVAPDDDDGTNQEIVDKPAERAKSHVVDILDQQFEAIKYIGRRDIECLQHDADDDREDDETDQHAHWVATEKLFAVHRLVSSNIVSSIGRADQP